MEELLKQALKSREAELFFQLMERFPHSLLEAEVDLLSLKEKARYEELIALWHKRENFDFWDKINLLPTGVMSLDPSIPQLALIPYSEFSVGDVVTMKANGKKATVVQVNGRGVKVRFSETEQLEWYFAVQFLSGN
ncbi:hypothetical protein [Gloeothece verrucosa]|uniref:Uncharacterized protein n=1 Tax=Gloeothece verrucosa (strain PCC 7822) TaxID=497965 RepID=E0UNT9_GLOV7|nr:hypothetical protein [Gloeothece verrucosa]ADN18619.1 hypothetical protein Cyan7822_6982 [Gloeothece verrucosa PCC 7822]